MSSVEQPFDAYKIERSELIALLKSIEKEIKTINYFIKKYGVDALDTFWERDQTDWRRMFCSPADNLLIGIEKLTLLKYKIVGNELKKDDDYKKLLKASRNVVNGDWWEGEFAGPEIFLNKSVETKWTALKMELLMAYEIKPEEVCVNSSEIESMFGEQKSRSAPTETSSHPAETNSSKPSLTQAEEKPQYVLSANRDVKLLDKILHEYDIHIVHIQERTYGEIYSIQKSLYERLEASGIKGLDGGGEMIISNRARLKDLEMLDKNNKVSDEQRLLITNNWEATKRWYEDNKSKIFDLLVARYQGA